MCARPSVCNLHQYYAIRMKENTQTHRYRFRTCAQKSMRLRAAVRFQQIKKSRMFLSIQIVLYHFWMGQACSTTHITFFFFFFFFLGKVQLLVWPLIGCVCQQFAKLIPNFTHNSVRIWSIALTIIVLCLAFGMFIWSALTQRIN